jgi:hypothetical protein
MERRPGLVPEDLTREGPGSLLATLRLLSRARRGDIDVGLPSSGDAGGMGKSKERAEGGVSGSG